MKRDISPFLKDYREPDGMIDDILEWDSIKTIPNRPGVYIIVSPSQRFIYPNGESCVIYIGMSVSLASRLQQYHRRINEIKQLKKTDRNKDWYYGRYQYINTFGGKIYYFTTRGTQDEKNLEEKILAKFYDRFLSLPVGNGAFSFGR